MSVLRASSHLGLAAWASMALSGCGVVETRPFTSGVQQRPGASCASPFGAYYLPKARITLNVIRGGADKILPSKAHYQADPQLPACLDYLESYTSDDTIRVTRTPDGLLQSVTSNVRDRTPDIAIKLINAAADAALLSRLDGESKEQEKIDVTFDPLEPSELLPAKKALRRFGVCLYVENESFDRATTRPQDWCARREVPRYRSALAAFSAMSASTTTSAEGILYRPNISHKIVVMRKMDPDGPGEWTLTESKRVDMPNISPVFSLAIQRTLFSQNQTEVTFNKGVLADIRIDKGSELYGAVVIPLALAQRLSTIPTELIQLRIADTQADIAMLQAETALFNATLDYAKAVTPPPQGAGASELLSNCLNGAADSANCLKAGQDQ